MNRDRGFIWNLIAMGRISPKDAERLLALTSDEDDLALRLAVLLAVVWVVVPHVHEVVVSMTHAVGMVAPRMAGVAHQVAGELNEWWRGVR